MLVVSILLLSGSTDLTQLLHTQATHLWTRASPCAERWCSLGIRKLIGVYRRRERRVVTAEGLKRVPNHRKELHDVRRGTLGYFLFPFSTRSHYLCLQEIKISSERFCLFRATLTFALTRCQF